MLHDDFDSDWTDCTWRGRARIKKCYMKNIFFPSQKAGINSPWERVGESLTMLEAFFGWSVYDDDHDAINDKCPILYEEVRDPVFTISYYLLAHFCNSHTRLCWSCLGCFLLSLFKNLLRMRRGTVGLFLLLSPHYMDALLGFWGRED